MFLINECFIKGGDFAFKTQYLDHKEQFHFFSAPKRHCGKSTLKKDEFSLFYNDF
jgi:hypothetical protein